MTFITIVVAAFVVACGGDEIATQPAAAQEPPATEAVGAAERQEDGGDTEEALLDDWVTVTDEPSGATFQLPDPAEPNVNTATTDDGGEVALRNYAAITDDGIELGFNIIDTPGDAYDLEAGVEGVATTLGGEVVSSVHTEVSGQEAVDVEMTYGDDRFVLFTLISTDEYVMQTLASGPESERPAVEATFEQLNESLEVN
jgi:hypothetical protein